MSENYSDRMFVSECVSKQACVCVCVYGQWLDGCVCICECMSPMMKDTEGEG